MGTSSIRNLLHWKFVTIQSDICSVCQEIATSYHPLPPVFLRMTPLQLHIHRTPMKQ